MPLFLLVTIVIRHWKEMNASEVGIAIGSDAGKCRPLMKTQLISKRIYIIYFWDWKFHRVSFLLQLLIMKVLKVYLETRKNCIMQLDLVYLCTHVCICAFHKQSHINQRGKIFWLFYFWDERCIKMLIHVENWIHAAKIIWQDRIGFWDFSHISYSSKDQKTQHNLQKISKK